MTKLMVLASGQTKFFDSRDDAESYAMAGFGLMSYFIVDTDIEDLARHQLHACPCYRNLCEHCQAAKRVLNEKS